MTQQQQARLEIFRAGTHVAVDGRKITFTPEVIAELAESYDPQLAEAPLVVGHPKLDAPAYGWVKSLVAEGDMLYAQPHQVEPQFAELVNAGRFKTKSASIYMPDSPGNPKPGKHYVKHVGFLGAAAPSIKGLKHASFAEGDGAVEFAQPLRWVGAALVDVFQRMRDWMIEREGAETADKIIPQWAIREIDNAARESTDDVQAVPAYAAPPTPETTMTEKTAEFAEREQTIAAKEAEVAAREAAIKARENQARRDDAVEFADGLVTAGKLLPRERDSVVELLLAIPADVPLSFAEGEGTVEKPAIEVFKQLLTDAPVRIDFKEKSPAGAAPAAVAFASPDNLPVDAGRADLHSRALAYQAEHSGTSYLDAVRAVSV